MLRIRLKPGDPALLLDRVSGRRLGGVALAPGSPSTVVEFHELDDIRIVRQSAFLRSPEPKGGERG